MSYGKIKTKKEKENKSSVSKSFNLGKWSDGSPITQEDELGRLKNNKQIKAYRDYKYNGFSHKVAMELALDE